MSQEETRPLDFLTNQNIAYYYSYDVSNRITGVTDSNLREIKYTYDTAGNRTSMITPEGKTIKYEYNVNNQMTRIATEKGNYTFSYDSLNRRIKRTLPNHTYTTYAYDQLSRLTNITHKNAFNHVIDSVNYTHDNVGNRITKTDGAFVPDGFEKMTNYSYDVIYRLTKALPQAKDHQHKLPEEIIKHQTEAYSYDPVGNRQTGPQVNDSYTYDSGNELQQDKNHQYVYDLNGNLIKKTETIGQWKIITNYTYDDENRLTDVKIQRGNKVKEISFTYDPFGRRISKTVHKEEFDEDHDKDKDNDKDDHKDNDWDKDRNEHKKNDYPQTTYYVYDDQNIIAEYDQKGKQIASYIHGPNTDEPLSAEIKNDWIYYHADGLGSINALTNYMGNTIQRYEYDSFGNIKHNPYPRWITQPYTYTGREMDYETGLYYYRARYYSPQIGRFITKDPVGFAGGDVNFYAYVGNNPVNNIDPEGEVKCTYTITGKTLTCTTQNNETISCYAISGDNNPGHQCLKDIGPIPTGPWQIARPYTKNRARLSELPGNSNYLCKDKDKRTGLQIHAMGTTIGCVAVSSCVDKIMEALECENGGILYVSP